MNFHLINRYFHLDKIIFGLIVAYIILSPCVPSAAQNPPKEDIRGLVIGQRTERFISEAQLNGYTVILKRNQVLKINIHENGADVTAIIARAEGQTFSKVSAASGFAAGFGQESVTLICPQDGLYVLVISVTPVIEEGNTAKYDYLVAIENTPSESDKQRFQAEKTLEDLSPLFNSEDKQVLASVNAKCDETIKLWQGIGDKYWEAITKLGAAAPLLKTGNLVKAKAYLNDALKVFEADNNRSELSAALANLAVAYNQEGKKDLAAPILARARGIAHALGDKRTEDLIALLAGASLVKETANKSYVDELAAAKAKKDKTTEANIWADTIFSYALDDEIDSDEKLEFLEKAEAEAIPLARSIKDRDIEMKILVGLGMGLPEAVEEATDEAGDGKKAHSAVTRAKIYLGEALMISKNHTNQLLTSMASMGLNVIYDYDEEGNDKLAIYFGKKMINSMQQLRTDLKITDKETQQDVGRKIEEGYSEVAQDLFYQERFAESLQIINLSRDQEFFDFKLLRSPKALSVKFSETENENDKIFEKALGILAAKYVNSPYFDYKSAETELNTVFSQIEKNSAGPVTVKDISTDTSDLSDIQFALGELYKKTGQKHAVIYLMPETEDILLVTPQYIKGFQHDLLSALKGLDSPKPFPPDFSLSEERSDDRILDFLNVLRTPDLDPRPLGALIYQRIFKTVEAGANKKQPLTIEKTLESFNPDVVFWSLSGNMRYVPVAALYDAEKKQYLVEKFQNVIFTRAKKERFLIEPKPWNQGLAFGSSLSHTINLNGRTKSFSGLSGVKKEILTIFGDQLTNQKGYFFGQTYLDQKFTRQQLLLNPKPAIVHISSHFVFQPGDASNSFLLLGDGTPFPLSEMQRTANMFEGVDLLTLSACETAAQQSAANGKEIDGFAELVQRLGASSVIATLWNVSENSSAKLLMEFYRLRKDAPGSTKAETLRNAQLSLLNGSNSPQAGAEIRASRPMINYSAKNPKNTVFKPAPEAPFEHPYYWSSFVLFGGSR
jgi:CHAT domain-containing protein